MSLAVRPVIRGVGHSLPPRVVTNHDLEKLMDTSDEWIIERTGIRERRFAEPGVPSSALAIEAAQEALDAAGCAAKDLDLIIASTLSPDYYFPGIGTIIQHKLGCRNVGALDIRAQCSGFVYGLQVAQAYLAAGLVKRVLLVASEVQSTDLNLTTAGRDTAVLFGDGAGAVVLEAGSADADSPGVIGSVIGCDGSGVEVLSVRTPGSATPGFIRLEDIENGLHFPHMDGRTVFKNAVVRMTQVVGQLLEQHHVSPDQIDLLFPHQANMRINEFLRERLKLPPERVFNNIEKYGNTTSATIPICLWDAQQQGRLKPGMLVVTVAFGSGFTWGANLIRWA